MDLPALYTQPITGFDVHKLRQLNWDWICWLKDTRQQHEARQLAPDKTLLEKVIDYFAAFQREDGFINLSDSYEMPGDARVDFIYIPTAVACAIVNLLKPYGNEAVANSFLQTTLPATAGRNFNGTGYDGKKYMAFTIELFAWGNLLPILVKGELTELNHHKKLFACYRQLTDQLLEPNREHSWGDIEDDWAAYCLRLINCEGNNWSLLQSSPLSKEFERIFRYRDETEILNEAFKDE